MIPSVYTRYFEVNKGQSCLAHLHSIALYSHLNNWHKLNVSPSNIKPLILRCNERNWFYFFMLNLHLIMFHWQHNSESIPIGFISGVSDGQLMVFLSKTRKGAVASLSFPPLEKTIVKAIACELPRQQHQPLAGYSLADLLRRVEAEVQVGRMSRSTIWRILSEDAIKPWQHRCWIFPRDPDFVEKARVVLDLYAGYWQGEALTEADFVISADEKTSIQARLRLHPTLAPAPGQPMRYEHEYERAGALQYLAAWDVRRGLPIGRCEAKTGIEPFHRLVDMVMSREPYSNAERVFWIVDGGSSHRGERFAERLRSWYANAIAVALPVHASWLNQIEIYFSIVQRKVLTPNDFINLDEVKERLKAFESYYTQLAEPFHWQFTTKDLEDWYERLQDWERLKRAA